MAYHNGQFNMENLIQELQLPRQVAPSSAAIRASKELQRLLVQSHQDTQARILAEQKLVEAFGDVQRLTEELRVANEKINNLINASNAASTEPSDSEVQTKSV